MNNFCVFILTHGRPDSVYTYKTLLDCNCTYPIYFVIDNEDKTAEQYYKNYGNDRVVMFDKLDISKRFDAADNFDNRKCIIYARNACFEIAEKLGYEYFIQLDDDYTRFQYLYDNKGIFCHAKIKNIDKIFDIFLKYLKSANIKTLCFLQGGDLIGGEKCTTLSRGHYPFRKRKAMNSFFCSTKNSFKFVGRINEDVNTYTSRGARGELFMTIPLVGLNQKETQKNKGGMTETYLDGGTYLKSFYTVMFSPSCTKVYLMGLRHKRLHHKINWENAVPKIIDENFKKR